jgi:hypothetical protein
MIRDALLRSRLYPALKTRELRLAQLLPSERLYVFAHELDSILQQRRASDTAPQRMATSIKRPVAPAATVDAAVPDPAGQMERRGALRR